MYINGGTGLRYVGQDIREDLTSTNNVISDIMSPTGIRVVPRADFCNDSKLY